MITQPAKPQRRIQDICTPARRHVPADIEPRFTTWRPHGKSEAEFVMDLNLHRRHLTTSQRAMVAEKWATMKLGGNQHSKEGGQNCPPSCDDDLSLQEAADRVGVSRRQVVSAKALARKAPPEVVELVKRGSMTISGAQDAIAHASDIERMELGQAAPPHEVGSDANRARNDTRKF